MKKSINSLLSSAIAIACFVFMITISVSCDPEEPQISVSTVVASFEAQVNQVNSLNYEFINNSLVDGSNEASFTSSWDFGGDGTSTDKNPTHTFSSEGIYEIKLIVTANGEVDSVINTVIVELTLSSPIAGFDADQELNQELTFSFTNTSVVNDIPNTSFTSLWDFGGDGTSTEESPTYTFPAAGFYDVKLIITAADGEVGSAIQTIEVKAIGNKYASITDTKDYEIGQLRLILEPIKIGRVSFMYRVAEGPGMDIKDGFIMVTGSQTTGDMAITELRLKDDATHSFREGASDDVVSSANFPQGQPNVWVPIEITWKANGSTAPLFSVTIGGQSVITDAVSTTNGGAGDVDDHLANVVDGAETLIWRYNAVAAISDGVYHVDDIVVYSSDSGTETVVFEDNFEARILGQDLNPIFDTNSPYSDRTSDAAVGADW